MNVKMEQKTLIKLLKKTDKIPIDFYFELTAEETHDLRFQIGTTNKMTRLLPHVFTEQGIAMFSSVLRTEVSAQASINIMRAFVVMKKYISNNLIEQKYINKLVLEDHENLKLLQESFNKLQEKEKLILFFMKVKYMMHIL